MTSISSIAAELGLSLGDLEPLGSWAAKVRPETVFKEEPLGGRLVLISALSPTPAGEGKTTVTIGLTDAARRRGESAVCALRQPSQGPVFGLKGGGTGGGRATLVPSERINLHFTGDLHAVTAANNLLASLADNDIYFRGAAQLDPRQLLWKRALDLNDRFLRKTIIGLGGKSMGVPREDGFEITAPRNSSISSAAPAVCGPTRWCSSPRCARSSSTAAHRSPRWTA